MAPGFFSKPAEAARRWRRSLKAHSGRAQSNGHRWLPAAAAAKGNGLPQLNGNAFPLPGGVALLAGAVFQTQIQSAARLAANHDL